VTPSRLEARRLATHAFSNFPVLRFKKRLAPLPDLRRDVRQAHHLDGAFNCKHSEAADYSPLRFPNVWAQRRIAVETGPLHSMRTACPLRNDPQWSWLERQIYRASRRAARGLRRAIPLAAATPDCSPPDPGLEETR
jgi:hypothetical protein